MVIEQRILPYSQWLVGNLGLFVLCVFLLALVAIGACFLLGAIRLGPSESFFAIARTIASAVEDFSGTSLRRVYAMARLAVQESLRRKVLIVIGLFGLLVLLAGWFLDIRSDHPSRLYLSFVLTSTNYLIVLLALLLSTFSLPNDMKYKTIHTIVTKPVRPHEIVFGRILGFCFVGTLLIMVMCAVSYGFVRRGLSHRHEIDADTVVGDAQTGWTGKTTHDAYHEHSFRVGPDGVGETDLVMDHRHSVRRVDEGGKVRFLVGPPEGDLQARVPVYGRLRFIERGGGVGKGINVGDEWEYRSYIEGGTLAAAVWTFDGITPDRFPDGLSLEATLQVFRTHKGFSRKDDEIPRISGTIVVANPDPARPMQSEPRVFVSEEFSTQRIEIPRKLKTEGKSGAPRDIDLFEDLVNDRGEVEIWIRCSERGQFFGMAQPDLYLRAGSRPFWWNFLKGYFSLWFQMVLVTSFGVMFSSFLSGPVALLATLSSVVLGFFSRFVRTLVEDVFRGEDVGGGPVESLVRTVTQANMSVDLELNFVATKLIKFADYVLLALMWVSAHVLPNYEEYGTARYVAYGFNIDGNLVAAHSTILCGYVLVIALVGYFFLKTREVAA